MKAKFYIKRRSNPQTGTYHVAMGMRTREEARAVETGTLYGTNKMIMYPNEKEYLAAIAEIEAKEGRISRSVS